MDAWHFSTREKAAAPQAAHDMAAMDAGAAPDRVPIEVGSSTVQDLGIHVEEVRRESLTQSVRAVATIFPDE